MKTSTKLLVLNYVCHFIFGGMLSIIGFSVLLNPTTYFILILYVIMLQLLAGITGYEKAKEEAQSKSSSPPQSQR